MRLRTELATSDRRPTRKPVRLTRRGRLVTVGTLTLGLLAGAGSIATVSSAGGPSTAPRGDLHLRHVVVAPGDTLWGIASRAAPGADPRATVAAIIDLNGLTGPAVVPGQQLVLPPG